MEKHKTALLPTIQALGLKQSDIVSYEPASETPKLTVYAYYKEMQQFEDLLKKIYESNKKDYNSQDEVFDLFARATMTGKLLPIARLIEKTFGKGSFRELGIKMGGYSPTS